MRAHSGKTNSLANTDLGRLVEQDLARDKGRVRGAWDWLTVRHWRMTMVFLCAMAAACVTYYEISKDASLAAVFAAVAGMLTAGFALARGAEQRSYEGKLARRQKALEILSGWNAQTAAARSSFEKRLPGVYDDCKRITAEEARCLYSIAPTNEVSRAGPSVDASVRPVGPGGQDDLIQLLNYFEYISVAYLRGAADRDTVLRSFAGTMVRYYCILGEFMLAECRSSGRNPWAPYTEFVDHVIRACGRVEGLADEIGIQDCVRRVSGLCICLSTRENCASRQTAFRLLRRVDDRDAVVRDDGDAEKREAVEDANLIARFMLDGKRDEARRAFAELKLRRGAHTVVDDLADGWLAGLIDDKEKTNAAVGTLVAPTEPGTAARVRDDA